MSQQVLNDLKQVLPGQRRCGCVANPLLLPVHCDLTVALEKQRARPTNFQSLGLLTSESHFAGLFLSFECGLIQHNPREIRRQRDLWKPERTEHELTYSVECELLPYDRIESHVRATPEN